MKTFQTGKTIRLYNIEDSYWDLNVGDIFYNFVKDIATPKYEVLDKKYIFRSVDPDDIDENGNMYTYNPVEVSKDDFKDTGLFLAVTSDDGGQAIIVLTIKNLETGEIFESAKAAAKSFGKKGGHVHEVCNGKREKALGYHWEWVKDE
jgi:hypothetical protein